MRFRTMQNRESVKKAGEKDNIVRMNLVDPSQSTLTKVTQDANFAIGKADVQKQSS